MKKQKIISVCLVALVAFLGFEVLIYLGRLNTFSSFMQAAFWLWLYLALNIVVLYDLHFKRLSFSRGHYKQAGLKFGSALVKRIEHFKEPRFLKSWGVYLILPGIIFWSTVATLAVNAGRVRVEQFFSTLSALALAVFFWYVKEIFSRKEETMSFDVYSVLSALKIYAALLLFGSAFSVFRYYCLEGELLAYGVFSCVFLLLFQALYHEKRAKEAYYIGIVLIAFLQALSAYGVYIYWGYDSLTAAVFLTAVYNLLWGLFYHITKKDLNLRLALEIVFVSLFIAGLALSVTNFKAQIIPAC